MGHLFHGTSRALASQVLKYGVRTINGSTGGVRVEQLERAGSSKQNAANADSSRILEIGVLNNQRKGKSTNRDVWMSRRRSSDGSMYCIHCHVGTGVMHEEGWIDHHANYVN
jgi:hypothetical protein